MNTAKNPFAASKNMNKGIDILSVRIARMSNGTFPRGPKAVSSVLGLFPETHMRAIKAAMPIMLFPEIAMLSFAQLRIL